jgi:predicted transcriptional regulator
MAKYEPTPEELAGIDRGLRAAAEGRVASEQEVEAVFAKFRGKWKSFIPTKPSMTSLQ